jgi:hypothetical protein
VEERDVKVRVTGYPDSDAQEHAELAWRLDEAPRQLDVDGISRPELKQPREAAGSGSERARLIETWMKRHGG